MNEATVEKMVLKTPAKTEVELACSPHASKTQKRLGWTLIAVTPIIAAALGYWAMVTQQKYEQVNDRAMLYEKIIENSREAVIITDDKGSILKWNHGAELLFGVSSEEAVGSPTTFIMPEEAKDAHLEAFFSDAARKRLLAGEVSVVRCWALGADGPIYVAIRVQAVEGSEVHFVAQINRDEQVKVREVPKNKKPPANLRPRHPKQETIPPKIRQMMSR